MAKSTANLKIVREYDQYDGWIDVTGPVTEKKAQKVWNEYTANGTKCTKYSDGRYYKIFPADTRMIVTPEFLGR